MSFVNSDTFFPPPNLGIFISCSCPIILARTSSTMLTRSWEMKHPSLFLSWGKSFWLFIMGWDVLWEFIYGLSHVREAHSILSILNVFTLKGCYMLSNALSESVEMLLCARFLHLLKPIFCVFCLDRMLLLQEEGKSVPVILSWQEAQVPQICYFELSSCWYN